MAEDELRDRIARVLDRQAGADAADCIGLSSLADAQAVIDNLGLTVETAMDDQYGQHARVVGRWGESMTYQPPEDVVRDAMEEFGLTHEEAVAEIRRIDIAYGIADEEES